MGGGEDCNGGVLLEQQRKNLNGWLLMSFFQNKQSKIWVNTAYISSVRPKKCHLWISDIFSLTQWYFLDIWRLFNAFPKSYHPMSPSLSPRYAFICWSSSAHNVFEIFTVLIITCRIILLILTWTLRKGHHRLWCWPQATLWQLNLPSWRACSRTTWTAPKLLLLKS